MPTLDWRQQFVLYAGLLLVLIQFSVSGQAQTILNVIWGSNG